MKTRGFITFCFITFGAAVLGFADGNFKVLNKFVIGGEGGWDFVTVDPMARRLYISHSKLVEVVDIDSMKIVGILSDTLGVHGVALAPSMWRGYISEGKGDTVAIFDLMTLKITGKIKTGKNPDSVVFDPATKRVFTHNAGSNNTTVIDANLGKVISTLPLGGKPEFSVADGKGHVYVNLVDKNSLTVIDSRGLRVEKTWPLSGCEEPTSMALDQNHRRLFIGCKNKVMAVVDADHGNVITTLPIGDRVDATVFDQKKDLIFNSNGDGTLTVIQEDSADKYHVVENVPTQRGARTVALDMKTHRLFLPTAEFGPSPKPTAETPNPRPPVIPGTFAILVVGQ